ncbi:MAG: EamA family transporter [Bacteroidetes bacterium]|nr:EamA family transporter [Bacteroidota bacterium]
MIALILSIFASVCIFVLFKLFGKFRIDTFQAIVFNYFTALLCGIVFFKNEWDNSALSELTWLPSVLVCAVLFISIFALMGTSSLKNGIGSTSVAAKMSMGLSMGIMIFLYKEPFTTLKVIGIVLATIGVLLVSIEKTETTSKGKSFWMLIVIFTGSVVLDVLLNYSQRYLLGSLSPSLFTAIAFGIAGIIGLLTLMTRAKKNKISLKNIIAGIFLGIPNFFSIYLLLEAYETAPLNDSDVVAIINICIVCLSTLVGFICFSEKLTSQKIIGIISIIFSIYLISEY